MSMKTLYQLMNGEQPCFTRANEEEMKHEVEFRKEEYPYMDWSYREVEVDWEELGVCINDKRIVPDWERECSVGSVKKMRGHRRKELEPDRTCKTCPYFISHKDLHSVVEEQRNNIESGKEV